LSIYSGDGGPGAPTSVLVTTPHPSGHMAVRHLTHHVHHSPSGFGWGYAGSGPSELARCILWDHTGTEPHPATYQAFKEAFLVRLPWPGSWTIDSDAITNWLRERELTETEVSQRFLDIAEHEDPEAAL
jgi:hypothetical protein